MGFFSSIDLIIIYSERFSRKPFLARENMVNTGFWSSSSSSSGGIGSSNSNSDSSDSSADDTESGGAADSDGSSSSPSRLSRWSRKIRSFRHKIPSSSKHHHHHHRHHHNNRRHSTDMAVAGSSCVRCNGSTPPPLLSASAATAEGISCFPSHIPDLIMHPFRYSNLNRYIIISLRCSSTLAVYKRVGNSYVVFVPRLNNIIDNSINEGGGGNRVRIIICFVCRLYLLNHSLDLRVERT
uniref:Uncharacterized protein n=1 Tax=Sipha flava TaxID=143950 RepID=A0A2S2RA45_9HEMI